MNIPNNNNNNQSSFSLTEYFVFQIMAFVDRMAHENPSLVKKSVIGKSVEGRDIIMLAITSDDKSNRWGRITVKSKKVRSNLKKIV